MKITTRTYDDFAEYVAAFTGDDDLVIFYRALGNDVVWIAAISKTLDRIITCESPLPITTKTQIADDYSDAVENSAEVVIA